ncbi:MAG: hypothetical protein J7M29_12600 [Verrucomicrobia bacterium]|nr:hypothetical protein [Verrucomicrobiota bacterium]
MSTPSEFGLDLDLEFLPAWARQPSTTDRYATHEGEAEKPRKGRKQGRGRRERREDRRERRPFQRGERRSQAPSRPAEPEVPLPEINVSLTPDPEGVASLAKQIRFTGRAYPLFDIARLILQRPQRYSVEFSVKKQGNGSPIQPLYVCSLDESVWLSEEEATRHVLKNHFETFYQTEKIQGEPPKGVYTFVAQCGLSGEILGPPNYHGYQKRLRELHAERFAHIPFDQYKAKVRMIKDPEAVKRWIEEMSWRKEYICLNTPESQRLKSMEEVERHFRETHLANICQSVEKVTLPAAGKRPQMSRGLRLLLDQVLREERKFPIRLARTLSQQFAAHGLQFFKVNKTVTHVCVSRPHYLDIEHTAVSDRVRQIITFINEHPGCTRRDLIEGLAPGPTPLSHSAMQHRPQTEPPQTEQASSEASAATEEKQAQAEEPTGPQQAAAAEAQPAEKAESEQKSALSEEPTPEQQAIIADLHWLLHQGHVIEFTDGHMETAKPPRTQPAPQHAKERQRGGQTQTGTTPQPAEEQAKPQASEVSPPAAPAGEASKPNAPESAPADRPAAQEAQTPEEKSSAPETPTEPPSGEGGEASAAPAPSGESAPQLPAEGSKAPASDAEETKPRSEPEAAASSAPAADEAAQPAPEASEPEQPAEQSQDSEKPAPAASESQAPQPGEAEPSATEDERPKGENSAPES